MAFKFYIDGQLGDNPDNDMSLLTKVDRSDIVGGMTVMQENRFTWSEPDAVAAGTISVYSYLKSVFDNSLCSECEIVIYDEVAPTETYLNSVGIIKVTQLEFDEQRTSVSVKVQDNSFLSYILNNWELKVDFRAIQSKNKIDITPIEPYHIDLFNGCTGDYGSIIGAYYHGYSVVDILDFLIRVITDEKVSFQSTYLSSLEHPPMLFKGEALLNPYTLFPSSNPVYELSLREVMKELNAIYNLSFFIDNTNPDAPVFRLEDTQSTYSFYGGYTFDEPLFVKTSVDETHLYGAVNVGSTITVDGSNSSGCIYTMNEAISYYGFKLESFYPLGQCNRNTSLNLENNWIISNNVIQDIIVGQSTAYIDDYVLIECSGVDTVGLTGNGHQFDFFGQTTPPFFYNLGINNFNKLQRHSDKFETAFGNFLGVGSLGFKALLGDDPSQDITYMTGSIFNPNFIPPSGLTIDPAPFPNETTQGGYDGSNNYDNVLFRYVVPADGDYSFHGHLNEEVDGTTIDYFETAITITQYDSGMVQKSTGGGGQSFLQDGFHQIDGTLVCNAVVGDIIEMSYSLRYIPNQAGNQNIARTLTVIWDSYFECNGTPEGGITITSGNNSIRKLIHEFEYSVAESDWRTILANVTGSFRFTKDGVTRIGWIKEMTHSAQTGLNTTIKLISSNAAT